jgi:transposase
LKGEEVCNKHSRIDPITGESYGIKTQSDLRNAYSIIGFCGFDMRTAPFFYHIGEQTNDSAAFGEAVDDAIAHGFLRKDDVLIMDNATIHMFKENEVLEEYLWEAHGIFMLTLPTRSPEMNPIELLWNTLVMRMKRFFVEHQDGLPIWQIATRVMDSFNHTDVFRAFRKCGYIDEEQE